MFRIEQDELGQEWLELSWMNQNRRVRVEQYGLGQEVIELSMKGWTRRGQNGVRSKTLDGKLANEHLFTLLM